MSSAEIFKAIDSLIEQAPDVEAANSLREAKFYCERHFQKEESNDVRSSCQDLR